MRTIDLLAGTDIRDAAALLVASAPACADFNGIRIRARFATTNPRDIVAMYWRLSDERSYVYQCSPEGRRAADESKRDVAAKQATVDRMMLVLPDFDNVPAVLAWVDEFTSAADRVGVMFNRSVIVDAFKAGGWPPGINCGDDFDGDDARNFAGRIVGQVLDGYEKHGACPPIVHSFVEQWSERFEGVVT